MKAREILVTSAAVASTLTGCSGPSSHNEKPDPSASYKTVIPDARFLSDGNQSDVYQTVNCDANPNDHVGMLLPNPSYDSLVTISLGIAKDPLIRGTHKTRESKMIGGATLYLQHGKIEAAYSNGALDVLTPGEQSYGLLQAAGHVLIVSFGIDNSVTPANIPEATITCAKPSDLRLPLNTPWASV